MNIGDVVLLAGQVVTPGTVAALYALGLTSVPVVRRPSVSILTTGDELRTPEQYDDVRTGAGVPDSNGPMLAAAVAHASGVPILLGAAKPVHIVTTSVTSRGLVNISALAVVDAQG